MSEEERMMRLILPEKTTDICVVYYRKGVHLLTRYIDVDDLELAPPKDWKGRLETMRCLCDDEINEFQRGIMRAVQYLEGITDLDGSYLSEEKKVNEE